MTKNPPFSIFSALQYFIFNIRLKATVQYQAILTLIACHIIIVRTLILKDPQ